MVNDVDATSKVNLNKEEISEHASNIVVDGRNAYLVNVVVLD